MTQMNWNKIKEECPLVWGKMEERFEGLMIAHGGDLMMREQTRIGAWVSSSADNSDVVSFLNDEGVEVRNSIIHGCNVFRSDDIVDGIRALEYIIASTSLKGEYYKRLDNELLKGAGEEKVGDLKGVEKIYDRQCVTTTADKQYFRHEQRFDIKMPDQVNSPTHYNQFGVEVIDMMVKVFGKKKTKAFCELNAFKYQLRAGEKGDAHQDLAKKDWYLDKMRELNMKKQ